MRPATPRTHEKGAGSEREKREKRGRTYLSWQGGRESLTYPHKMQSGQVHLNANNRLTATVNGGTAWSRPGTAPAASDTVLVISYGYQADSVQQVQVTDSPTGGTFTLTFNGQTTAAIAYNATAAAVQTALQDLSSIGSGNALVAGGSGGPWQVRFAGTLGGSVQPALTGNGSGLTGGTAPSVVLTVTSLGGDAGRVQQTTDPRGIVTKTDYDPFFARAPRLPALLSGADSFGGAIAFDSFMC